jgi:hypothetical protein
VTDDDKTLARMRVNPRDWRPARLAARATGGPRDWRIEDLKTVARRHGVDWRQPGTSHVTFRAPDGRKITVPARKPIKPVYIRLFVALIDSLE